MSFLIFIVITSFLVIVWLDHRDISKKKNGTSFQPGDHVTAFGNVGVVKSVTELHVMVKFEEFESTVVFRKDGRLMKWHKQVSLKPLQITLWRKHE